VEVPRGCIAQPLFAVRGGLPESTLDDHAVTDAGAPVTRRAEHVVAFLPACHDAGGHRHREHGRKLPRDLAGVEQFVFTEIASWDGVRDERAGRTPARKELARLERLIARRVVHVLPTGDERHAHGDKGNHSRCRLCGARTPNPNSRVGSWKLAVESREQVTAQLRTLLPDAAPRETSTCHAARTAGRWSRSGERSDRSTRARRRRR